MVKRSSYVNAVVSTTYVTMAETDLEKGQGKQKHKQRQNKKHKPDFQRQEKINERYT